MRGLPASFSHHLSFQDFEFKIWIPQEPVWLSNVSPFIISLSFWNSEGKSSFLQYFSEESTMKFVKQRLTGKRVSINWYPVSQYANLCPRLYLLTQWCANRKTSTCSCYNTNRNCQLTRGRTHRSVSYITELFSLLPGNVSVSRSHFCGDFLCDYEHYNGNCENNNNPSKTL